MEEKIYVRIFYQNGIKENMFRSIIVKYISTFQKFLIINFQSTINQLITVH